MEKSKIIIVEGPQGTGKTTLSNFFRENLAGANLYRLSGQKDKTLTGKKYSIVMYNALIEYLQAMQTVPMDMIFDRTFFTEEVYGRLGYKEYSFTDEYQKLVERFDELDYDIYYISLYLKNVELFRERLARESHHNYQTFSLENSVNQQNIYKDIADELEKNTSIKVIRMEMDDFDVAYERIREIFGIEKPKGKSLKKIKES